MGSLADYTENKALDFVLGAQSFARVGTLYASLHTGTLTDAGAGAEVSGGSYARKAVTNNSTNFPAAVSRAKALAVQHDFPGPTGAWGTITDSGLWDASSAGNLIVADTIATPRVVGSGDVAPFLAAATSYLLSLTGDISTYLGNALLDHIFGGPDYTPPATVYLGLYVAGVEVSGNNYSRKSVANNITNFPAASGGTKSMAVAQEFAAPSGGAGSWGLVDEVRILDASSGGNTLWAKALTTPRTVGLNTPCRFSAGALTFALS